MEKFINISKSGKEKAIKIGKSAPSGSVALSWFESPEITPLNTLGMIDYSGTIIDNRVSEGFFGTSIVAYADELGFLRTAEGSYNFPTNDITVSDLPLSERLTLKETDISTVDSSDYVHYKYVSRHFISAPNSFSISSKYDYLNPDSIVGLSIKVLDKMGFEYIDTSLNRKKYRILLEPFRTEENKLRPEVPCRVIVLLDSSNPDGLSLVYDKVESDQSGSIFNMELSYSEPINAVPFFSEVPEESLVIDNGSLIDPSFSIKKIDRKYSEIVNGSDNESGYQLIVPNKAFSDYRNYEVFNWRLIARTRFSVDLNSQQNSGINEIDRVTVKVGVLYDSVSQTSNRGVNPYIFLRLQESPFNLFGYSFVNPNADSEDKTLASYWKVDINDISIDLSNYDVLAWSPSTSISANQAIRLKSFLERHKTLIVDLSAGDASVPSRLEGNLSLSRELVTINDFTVINSPVTDYYRNGAWDLLQEDYAKPYYGIWGSYNIGYGTDIIPGKYRLFKDSSYSLLTSKDEINGGTGSIAKFVPFLTDSDSLSRGNILATSYPLMSYCNSIYAAETNQNVVDSNTGESLYSSSFDTYPGIVEGPFKLLYNTCAYALYSAARSRRVTDERSAIYNYVSEWKPSWTMNQDVLLDSEKESIFTNVSTNTTSSDYARDILRQDYSDVSSIKDYVKKQFSYLSDFLVTRLESSIDDIEVYIEVTNPGVELTNATYVTEDEKISEDIPSSYTLYKVDDNLKKVYAKTYSYSPRLEVPSFYGNYSLVEKPINVSKAIELKDNFNTFDSLKSYPFSLNSHYTYSVPGEEKFSSFKVQFDADFSMDLNAIKYVATYSEGQEEVYGDTELIKKAINIFSGIDDEYENKATSSSSVNNIFPYTGDIDIHGITDSWKNGSRGAYVTYIQYTLHAYGDYYDGQRHYYPYALDEYYGEKTATAVKLFQAAENQRYIDGLVDSETKWYFAKFWKKFKANKRARYDVLYSQFLAAHPEAGKFLKAAVECVVASEIGKTTKPYRKTTFTKTIGPSTGEDYIYFEIPLDSFSSGFDTIEIKADSGSWSNYQITEIGLSSGSLTTVAQRLNKTLYNKITPVQKDASGLFKYSLGIQKGYRYGYIKVVGGKLGGIYGAQAEGFGIKSINIKGYVEKVIQQPVDPEFTGYRMHSTVPVDLLFEFSGIVNYGVINISRYAFFDIRSQYNVLRALMGNEVGKKLVGVRYKNKVYNQDYNITTTSFPSSIKININSAQDPDYIEVQIPNSISSLLDAIDVDSVEYTLTRVFSSTTLEDIWVPGSSNLNPIETVVSEGIVTFSTAAAYFEDAVYGSFTKDLSSGYTLIGSDSSGPVYTDQRATINIADGILLLCNEDGSPFGIPSLSEVRAQLSEVDFSTMDLRLGSIEVSNDEDSDGVIYGFFDKNAKEFLGTRLNYLDINNSVYIAVAAIDADGDLFSDNDYIGSSGNITFVPVTIPMKYISPIYSVVMNKPCAIKVSPLQDGLSRFDTWELPVSAGSFESKILIDGSFINSSWLNDYRGQTLLAKYSTVDITSNSKSKIYGYGNYDINDESPILIDDKRFQVRRLPILAWNHPSNYESSVFGVVRPALKLEIRSDIDSEWSEIAYSQIRKINCQTGVVETINRIIPADSDLIRISYTVKSKDLLLKRVGSDPIPLNPVTDYSSIVFNKPLFIYLMPTQVYSHSNSSNTPGSKVKVSEYEFTSAVNYTYEAEIFNKNSSKYNPLALVLASIFVYDKPERTLPSLTDVRTRGGGVVQDVSVNTLIEEVPGVLYNWDVYSVDTHAYPKAGYVVIRIPQGVRDHFIDYREVYNIIRNNLTAGIVFELQDMDGNSWS